MRPILLLTGNAAAADQERCRGFVGFLRRRARLDTPEAPEPGAAGRATGDDEILLRLSGEGLLSYAPDADGTVEVFYTPSREASRSVLEAGAGSGFPEAVQKKHAAAFRSSEGALLRFPAEQGEGHLEVFITDWSPCPAACAVAIHRAHPFAADVAKAEGVGVTAAFTGRYVRHPLTGDLLPVWVADWVRPDFGTGAVLVNPAHDATDLAFGRAVGLPIRFALVPAGYDGSPETWPQPPVVKSGQTIRTGPYDGLGPAEAAARYFTVMAERGLAVRHRDVQAGRWRIGRLVPDGAENRFAAAGLFAAAAAGADSSSPPILAAAAAEQAGELLALRLLAYDLNGRPLTPAAVYLVQKVQETKVEAPPEVVSLAALVGAPVSQVAVIKQQTIEQVQRFLRVHRELLAAAVAEPDDASLRAFSKVKAAVRAADPAQAFSLLLQAQKQLRDLSPAYLALAEAVAGLVPPENVNTIQAWSQIP